MSLRGNRRRLSAFLLMALPEATLSVRYPVSPRGNHRRLPSFVNQSNPSTPTRGWQTIPRLELSLSSTMQFAHFTALLQVAAHIYRSSRFLHIAINPSHHTIPTSSPAPGIACIREDAGHPLPTHGSDTVTTGPESFEFVLYSRHSSANICDSNS